MAFTKLISLKDTSKIILIYSRSSIITPFFLGKRIAIYNGNKFVSIIVRPLMVGSKFGEFAITKKLGSRIHKEGRLSKKKK